VARHELDGRLDLLAPLVVRNPEHRDVGDRRMRVEHGLDFRRIDVDATGDDRVGFAVREIDEALGVDAADVADAERAARDVRFCRLLGRAVILEGVVEALVLYTERADLTRGESRPALVDGDLVLFESMAINLYLAKTYGGKLYPRDPHDEARAIQWTIWGLTELEPHLIPMVIQKVFLPEGQRDPSVVANAAAAVERPLRVLDDHVSKREYLLGGDFTIADLDLAGVLASAFYANHDISKFENATRWMSRCTGRPSYARTVAMR